MAAGVIFTLPALIILGYWDVFDYWWVCLIAGLGGLLGVLFTVPLRRSLIVEQKLAFPEGAATAEVLKVGDDPQQGLRYLGVAALTGGLIKFAATGLRLWPGAAQSATFTSASAGGAGIAYAGTNLSPALLSVGMTGRVGKLAEVLAMVYFGGLNSVYGSIVGAVSISLLGEALRPLEIFKWIIIPLLLIPVMIYRPTGLVAFREFDVTNLIKPKQRPVEEG